MEVQQKYLKKTGLIALIAVMNMVVPLSLDMYLPAVPQMTQVFNTSESVVNITLVGFFFFRFYVKCWGRTHKMRS